jgi:hypothetical protein
MGSLGQIEALKRDPASEKDTFTLLGEDLELKSRPSGLDALEWAALSGEPADNDEQAAAVGVKMAAAAHRMLTKSLTSASYERFRVLCDENELGLDVVFQTVALLVGATAGKAQAKPSGSSDGPSATSTSSSSDLQAYTEQGLRLVPAEDWAKVHLAS